MNRLLFFAFLPLSSCTGLFSGSDRETTEDAATNDAADVSSAENDGAPDVGALPDAGADTPDGSRDNAADARDVDTGGDSSLLDGTGHDATADTRDGDAADDSSRLDGSDNDMALDDAGSDIGPTCPGACDVDSVRCDGPAGFVCEVRNGCGTWVQRVTCPGAEMCCPSAGQFVCVPSDENHCFSCTSACSGVTPLCSAQRKLCVCGPGSCPSSFGCDDATGSCTPCTTPAAAATDFYTDIRASAGGTGSADCPFRTITEALALARKSTAVAKTVHVAAGKYFDESFPLAIRNGITLAGAGAENVTIAGLGKYTSPLPHLQPFLATALLGDAARENVIRGVTLTAGSDARIAHYGVICDEGNLSTLNGSDPPKNPPNSILRDVAFGPDYDMSVGLFSDEFNFSGGNLRIDNAQFRGSWGAIWAATCDSSTTTLPIYGNIEISRSRFSGHTSAGVTLRGCVSVNIEDSVFEDSNIGLQSWSELAMESEHSRLRIAGSTFRRNYSIGAVFGGVQTELTNNTFIDNTTKTHAGSVALRLDATDKGRSIYARDNHFIGNDIAILLYGDRATDVNHLIDFGSRWDAGRNEFRCNSSVSSQLVRYAGFDVGLEAPPTPGWVFHLAGNQWDHDVLSVQVIPGWIYQTPPNDGVDVLLANGNAATAIDTSGATHWTGTCPPDHQPGPAAVSDAGGN